MATDPRLRVPLPQSPFQQVALVVLRTFIGWHFLYEGLYKLRLPAWTADGQPLGAWTATGFLKAATGPLAGLFRSLLDAGAGPWLDRAVIFGLLAVGLSLMLGLLTRIGCWGALALLAMFYFLAVPTRGVPQPNAEGAYLLVNKTLVEGLAVLVLLAFDTGRIAGLDRLWRARRPRHRAAIPLTSREMEQGS